MTAIRYAARRIDGPRRLPTWSLRVIGLADNEFARVQIDLAYPKGWAVWFPDRDCQRYVQGELNRRASYDAGVDQVARIVRDASTAWEQGA
jgi:hypothetical protein